MTSDTPSRPTVLYCDCSYTDLVSPELRRQVRQALAESSCDLHAVPDLCELAANQDARLAQWAAVPELHIIACHERAVRALFDRGGAPLRDDATIHNLRSPNMECGGSDAALAWLTGSCPTTDEAQQAKNASRIAALEQQAAVKPAWQPWFPNIERSRCINCKQCHQFCLFSVYEIADGQVRVAKPHKCKTGCPACARVCPVLAIVFPKCKDRPINGDEVLPDDLKRSDLRVDVKELSHGDALEKLRLRSKSHAAAPQQPGTEKKGRFPVAPAGSQCLPKEGQP